jgi:integrase
MSEQEIVDLAAHPRMLDKMPRFRTQFGVRIKLADGWYVRFWDWSKTGSAIARERVRAFLAPLTITDKDELDHLQEVFMQRENARQRCDYHPPDPKNMTVDQFFQTTFLPFIEQNKSRSTAKTYRNVWQMYCHDHFSAQPLVSYRTRDGYQFLNSLATRQLKKVKGLSQQSLNLVRTVCSHLFKHAKNLGVIEGENPIRDVEIGAKVRKNGKTVIYTPLEVAQVLEAIPLWHEPCGPLTKTKLLAALKARLLFALVALNGLRPSEAAALKWSNIEGDLLSIERGAPDGVIGDTKTEQSVAVIPIVPAVEGLLDVVCLESGRTEFLFPGRSTEVINASEWAEYNIKPHAKKVIGDRYKGLYPGRRRAGSTSVNKADSVAGSGLLRNSKGVLEQSYFAPYLEKAREATRAIQAEHEQAVAALKAES